jgi:hypothetical protein
MDQQNENIEFKSTREYLKHWDIFFEEWNKGESHQKKLLDNDKIWCNHKGTEWVNNKGEKCSNELEPVVFPQPYLGNIKNYSVITLNLNPSRSKYGNENFKEPDLKPNYKYEKYAEEFSTYDTHQFWKDQKGWIDRIFKFLEEEKPSEKKIKPFAIEICPWASKSWLGLEIKKETKKFKKGELRISVLDIPTEDFFKYLDNYVFDVIEKVNQKNIFPSKIKLVTCIGKDYYDIFNHNNSGFEKLSEFTKSKKTNNEVFAEPDTLDENFISKIKENWPLNKNNVFTNRSFSFWKRNNTLYYNVFPPNGGKNNPPGKNFNEVEEEFFRIYKSLIK